MIYLIGGRGFVGSAYARLCAAKGIEHRVITRENYASFRGTSCDVLINANGNSRKPLSEREPLTDFDMSVRSVADTLSTFKAGTYVFVSSGDVYPNPSAPETSREDQVIDVTRVSRYGLHKYLAEQLVVGAHPDWVVVRLGGVVGPGLKKNAVFDMLTGGPVWLTPDSELQFISTDRMAELVWRLVEKGVRREIVNLGANGRVRLGDLHAFIDSPSSFRKDAKYVRYELSLKKLAALVDAPLPETGAEVEAFVAWWRQAPPP